MYNQAYIDTYNEKLYLVYLNNPSKLKELGENYLKRYKGGSIGDLLAFKESLDHYVAKRISEDPTFISSSLFNNFMAYLQEITRNSKVLIQNKQPITFQEFNTNIVYRVLTEEQINQLWSNSLVLYFIQNGKIKINELMTKIRNGEILSGDELNFLSSYFNETKNLHKEDYELFISYIFSHRKGLNPTPELLSAILSYLPIYYREGVENSRVFLSDYHFTNGGIIQKTYIGKSLLNFSLVQMEFSAFKNIDLNNFSFANQIRSTNMTDIIALLMVALHELTHQKQAKNLKREDTFDGAAFEIHSLLNNTYQDYEKNHDSDETEIDADERSWNKCRGFVSKFLSDVPDLSAKCYSNSKKVASRRAFSVKTDVKTNRQYRTLEYDIEMVKQAIKNNPSLLNHYPHLAAVFTQNGAINTNFLFDTDIATTPAGKSLVNYTFNKVPVRLLADKIQGGIYSLKQVENLLNNLSEVPHQNAVALRNLQGIDLETFRETRHNFDFNNLESLYHYYLGECCHQAIKFIQILTCVKVKFKEFSEEEFNGYWKWFKDYYLEMLKFIKVPDIQRLSGYINMLKNSGITELETLGEETSQYLNNTFGYSKQQSTVKVV